MRDWLEGCSGCWCGSGFGFGCGCGCGCAARPRRLRRGQWLWVWLWVWVWVMVFFDHILMARFVIKRCDMNDSYLIGIPSDTRNQSHYRSCACNHPTHQTNKVLVTGHWSSQEYTISPPLIKFAPQFLRNKPHNLLSELAYPLMTLAAMKYSICGSAFFIKMEFVQKPCCMLDEPSSDRTGTGQSPLDL